MRIILERYIRIFLWGLLISFPSCGSLTFEKKKKSPPNPAPAAQEEQQQAPNPPTPPIANTPIDLKLEPNINSMQSNLVLKNCIGCHSKATDHNRHVDLHDLELVITMPNSIIQPDHVRKVIKAGCPDSSIFYLVIKNNQMPPLGHSPISESNKEVIYKWIVALDQNGITNCNDEPRDIN